MNDVIVDMVSAEAARRRRRRVLRELTAQRAEITARAGVAEDSTPYIRSLREGRRSGG